MTTDTKTMEEHVEMRDAEKNADIPGLVKDERFATARDAVDQDLMEHSMSALQAARQYYKALFWSAVFGFCLIMQAYDTVLTGSFYALPAFQKQFGRRVGKTETFQLTPQWQTSLSEGATAGIVIGLLVNSYLVDRFGNRRVALVCLALIICFIFILFFAKNLPTLLVGELLVNIPLGAVNTIAPAYAVEVAPLALRHYGPTYVHLCVVLGHLVGSGILKIWDNDPTEWAWRLPYALQWVWPVPLFCLLLFAPESPWWLVRHGRDDEALASLKRLSTAEVDNDKVLALIQHTVSIEKSAQYGANIWDCFKGTDLRRTMIAVGSFFAQAMCGFCLPGGPYIFEQAGLSTDHAFQLNIGQYAMGSISTLLSFWVMERFSRRATLFIGTWGQMVSEGLMAILATLPNQRPALIWPQGVMVLVRFFFFGLSLGPLSYVTASEISSYKLRQKTLALSIGTFYLVTLVSNVVSPYLINPTAANLKGKVAWLSAGSCAFILVWGYFCMPETKGRSLEEIDVMFAKRLPTREFASYQVSPVELLEAEAHV